MQTIAPITQTGAIQAALAAVLDRYPIRTLVHAGCGDFDRVRQVPGLDRLASYLGIDLDEQQIRINRARYGNDRIGFQHADLTTFRIPAGDLVLAPTCLGRLPSHEARAVLSELAVSRAGYLLAGTFADLPGNPDLPGHNWRPVNLQAPPFDLPEPIEFFDTYVTEHSDQVGDLGLWRISDLPLESWFHLRYCYHRPRMDQVEFETY